MKCLIVCTVLLAVLTIVQCRSNKGSSTSCYQKKNNNAFIEGAGTIVPFVNPGQNQGQFKKDCQNACDDYESRDCLRYTVTTGGECRLYLDTAGSRSYLFNKNAELHEFKCSKGGSCTPVCGNTKICKTTRTGTGNDCSCESECVSTEPTFKIRLNFTVVDATELPDSCNEQNIKENVLTRLKSSGVTFSSLNNHFRTGCGGSDLFLSEPSTSIITKGKRVTVDSEYAMTEDKCPCVLGNTELLQTFLNVLLNPSVGVFNIPEDPPCPRVEGDSVELTCSPTA